MRSRNDNVGTAAYGSVARAQHLERQRGHRGALAYPFEELVERIVRLAPAVETAPQLPQAPDELVAGVDRHEVELGASVARSADEERFDVRLDTCEIGVRRDDRLPRLEREERLGRSRRARVERRDPVELGIDEEERDAHRDLQRVPLRRR